MPATVSLEPARRLHAVPFRRPAKPVTTEVLDNLADLDAARQALPRQPGR
jgi:hypothetical protein